MASQPRISVNKLGEYMTTTSAVRRRAIVRQQIAPPPAVVPRYRQATDPINAFLASGGIDVESMTKEIERLRQASVTSDWTQSDNQNTADALEHFLEVSDELPIDGIEYVRGDLQPPHLDVADVAISVRPDFLLRFQKRGRKYVGALKIHYIRDDGKALKTQGQEFVATLCRQWLSEHGSGGREVIHTHCFSLDLFRKSLVHAPASFTRRMKEVEAACADIALIWAALQ